MLMLLPFTLASLTCLQVTQVDQNSFVLYNLLILMYKSSQNNWTGCINTM